MECSIKSHYLRHIRKYCADGMDTKQVSRIVKRSEVAAYLDLLEHVIIDQGTSAEEISTLNYTVADCFNIIERGQHAENWIHQCIHDELHANFMIGDRKIAHKTFFVCGLVCYSTFRKTDFLNETFGQDVIDIVALHIQKLVFHRRAAAIDY